MKVYNGVKIRQFLGSSTIDELIIEDNVVICSGVKINGDRISIGKNSVIGKNVEITNSIAAGKIIPQSKICKKFTSLEIKLDSLRNLIGNTPLVEIKNIFSKPKVKIFAKV